MVRAQAGAGLRYGIVKAKATGAEESGGGSRIARQAASLGGEVPTNIRPTWARPCTPHPNESFALAVSGRALEQQSTTGGEREREGTVGNVVPTQRAGLVLQQQHAAGRWADGSLPAGIGPSAHTHTGRRDEG